MAALERIPPQIEAPQEERESPETVEEEPERAERVPLRHGRGSGGRTEAVVAQAHTEVTER